MILSAFFAATLTFTATATGVEKGTPIEFFFAGSNTDRDYEAMFLLEEPVADFAGRLDAIAPRGTPVDAAKCLLWPTGCKIEFDPPLNEFIDTKMPDGIQLSHPVYTGGTRQKDGIPEAQSSMPAAVFAGFSLPQSLIVFNEPQSQGDVYGAFTAKKELKKGTKIQFSLKIDEKSRTPKYQFSVVTNAMSGIIGQLRKLSATNGIEALISFAPEITVGEANAMAQALSVIDSTKVKINGCNGLYFRAFLPLEKWRDRQERVQQPFELYLHRDGTEKFYFIEEDWNVEGIDPKLTLKEIAYSEAKKHPKTTTCFIFAGGNERIERINAAIAKLSDSNIVNWYVFVAD